MYRDITPNFIQKLGKSEVFVFGSHVSARHNDGAAILAKAYLGACVGQKEGIQGQSYAIPIVGRTVTKRSLMASVLRFTLYALEHPELTFYVSEIHLTSRKFPAYQVAIMFYEASKLPNVYLPRLYWDELEFSEEFKASL